ncbi:M12 family metallopeptidase [Hymenobacter sp. BT175]|uniref:M12 family metallopeptidase n=1 Tax=Hymenobacter translucens TaxID=2886507 RepID=UPI001D0DF6CA|nr:M12 family metallopeptidase [Hymenobacter translucens]MCC2545930.1 M12 family metallopeptidase [Hymenobacter translucens]
MVTTTSKKRLQIAVLLAIVMVFESCSQDNPKQDQNSPPSAEASANASIRLLYGENVYTVYGQRSGDALLVEGDMLFPLPANTDTGMEAAADTGVTAEKEVQTFDGVVTANVWDTSGSMIVVPYTLNANVDTTKEIGKRIMDGMRWWRRRIPVQFRPSTSSDVDYAEFIVNQTESSSFVGCIRRGKQLIKLENNRPTGTVAHEIGHLLGLYHEQNRGDRSGYVTIAENCLKNNNYSLAFDKDRTAKDREPYNYYSIMHYPLNDCITINQAGVPVGTTLPKGVPGQRDSIAVSDVEAILYAYRLGQYQHIP